MCQKPLALSFPLRCINEAWFGQINKQFRRGREHLFINLSLFWVMILFHVSSDDFQAKSLHWKQTSLPSISLLSKKVDQRSKHEKSRDVLATHKHHVTSVCTKRVARPGTMQIRKYSMFTDSSRSFTILFILTTLCHSLS